MPNHFHFLLNTDNRCSVQIKQGDLLIDPVTNGVRKLLSGYARIFNARYNQSGSLFRQKTKAKCLSEKISLAENCWANNDYYFNSFHYIHQNPFKAGLVSRMEDWEYSSFKDYARLRNGTLCNKQLAVEYCSYNIDKFTNESYSLITEDWVRRIL